MLVQTASDLALLVRSHREAGGLSQAALAERAGVTRQWIVALERGQPRLELALVLRTLAALRLQIAVTADSDRDALTTAVGDATTRADPSLLKAPQRSGAGGRA